MSFVLALCDIVGAEAESAARCEFICMRMLWRPVHSVGTSCFRILHLGESPDWEVGDLEKAHHVNRDETKRFVARTWLSGDSLEAWKETFSVSLPIVALHGDACITNPRSIVACLEGMVVSRDGCSGFYGKSMNVLGSSGRTGW